MHSFIFFYSYFVVSTILLLFFYNQTVAGIGRKYQETSVPLDVKLMTSTNVKYHYEERRLFNRRRKGASFTLRSHFAHHICYTLDGSNPGCYGRSTNDNSKVHCKVGLSAAGDRDSFLDGVKKQHKKGDCRDSKINGKEAWCSNNKLQDYLRIDLKKREDTIGYAIAPRRKNNKQAVSKLLIDATCKCIH